MTLALERLCANAEAAVVNGENIIILSDRQVDQDNIPIPALLACAAVHHHLIRAGLRTSVGIVVESGEPREVHHFCTLAGYGAQAINPYLALQTISEMSGIGFDGDAEKKAHEYYIKAICKGILKVMSKMGISTYQSYCGAQIFDAVGLSTAFVERYFTRTHTAIEGVGINVIAKETVARHTLAYSDAPLYRDALEVGGDYAFRLRGEHHAWTPATVSHLQHAVRGGVQKDYDSFAKLINEQNEQLLTPRGMFEIQMAAQPVPIEEVETAAAIVRRFSTGAMSYGSISREAHTNLAIAMNRIGGRSNTGEGGEEPDRYVPMANGDSMRSAIKQVASGRFGVTAEYLVNSDMMQIKMAQGAKPGEGGQLPGHKVDKIIGKVRHSTPGVGLISPPPHHDIYSIEDLAQLIFDLKNVNPEALVSVKLVSEMGVGTVAAAAASPPRPTASPASAGPSTRRGSPCPTRSCTTAATTSARATRPMATAWRSRCSGIGRAPDGDLLCQSRQQTPPTPPDTAPAWRFHGPGRVTKCWAGKATRWADTSRPLSIPSPPLQPGAAWDFRVAIQ